MEDPKKNEDRQKWKKKKKPGHQVAKLPEPKANFKKERSDIVRKLEMNLGMWID